MSPTKTIREPLEWPTIDDDDLIDQYESTGPSYVALMSNTTADRPVVAAVLVRETTTVCLWSEAQTELDISPGLDVATERIVAEAGDLLGWRIPPVDATVPGWDGWTQVLRTEPFTPTDKKETS